MHYYAPMDHRGPHLHHGSYGPPPPRPATKDGKIAAIIIGTIAFFLIAAVLGVMMFIHLTKETVGAAFGECSTTPTVATVVIDQAVAQGYEFKVLLFNCNRDETARLRTDEADVWLATDTTYTESTTMLSDITQVYMDAGWMSHSRNSNVIFKDGYSVTFEAHSYDPAMVHLTVARESVTEGTAWKKSERTYRKTTITEEDVHIYGILPNYTPSYIREGDGYWKGYSMIDEYRLWTTMSEGFSPQITVTYGSIEDHWMCNGDPTVCTLEETLPNGLEVFKVTRYNPDENVYIAEHEGKVLFYQEVYREPMYKPENRSALPQEEVFKILGSIDLSAQPPAKSD